MQEAAVTGDAVGELRLGLRNLAIGFAIALAVGAFIFFLALGLIARLLAGGGALGGFLAVRAGFRARRRWAGFGLGVRRVARRLLNRQSAF